MAKVKALHTQPAKTDMKTPAVPVTPQDTPEPSTAAPSPEPEAPDFGPLWERFCAEASFNPETLDIEAQAVREEIASLEARIAEKQAELDEITQREGTARDKMVALLKVGFSAEAIISAMKVEFRAKKAPGRIKEKEVEIGEDEKTAVLDVLDREGQPLAEVARHVGRDAKEVQRVLLALVAEGRVNTQGERRGKVFMRV